MCVKLCDVTTLEKVTETCFPVSEEPTNQQGERAREHLSKHLMKTEKLRSERKKPWVSVYFDMGMVHNTHTHAIVQRERKIFGFIGLSFPRG